MMTQPARHRERAGKLYPLAIQSSASLHPHLGLSSSADERRGSGQTQHELRLFSLHLQEFLPSRVIGCIHSCG
jgi:hypothetical protein